MLTKGNHEVQMRKVYPSGLWVDPKFPFLDCSPDGLVGKDAVVQIKGLKLFKQYSVQTVTSSTSPVAKSVLRRRCFKVENGKCVLKRSHAYYYQCQQILLVTGSIVILFCMLQVVLIQWKGSQDINPTLKRFCHISQLCGL